MTPIFYCTTQGRAVANLGDDKPLKRLGQFASEREAAAACAKHYARVCRAADNFGRPRPSAHYI